LTTRRAPRSDGLRNREQILDAARELLCVDGGASLNAIAKRAGVGIGTLYRHFPARETLIMELYRADINALIDLASQLARRHPPMEALQLWLGEVARYARLKYGVAEVVHAATNGGLDDPAYQPFVAAIQTLLDAGSDAGLLKPGLDPEDVLLQLSVLWRIKPDASPGRPDRILQLIIDGLKRPAAEHYVDKSDLTESVGPAKA
jgi:AcrR family transcriptional regulator